MDKNHEDIINFIIVIIKCFFILLVLGVYLPQIIDYIIYYYFYKNANHENSRFVTNMLTLNKSFLYNFIHLIKTLLNIE